MVRVSESDRYLYLLDYDMEIVRVRVRVRVSHSLLWVSGYGLGVSRKTYLLDYVNVTDGLWL